MKRHLVAFDIGGSKVAVKAMDVDAEHEVYAAKLKTPADEGVSAMLRLIDAQIAKVPGGKAKLGALGVAVPGHVDDAGRVLQAGNLRGWRDVPLRKQLEDRYGVPVFVDKDANCGAIGEKWLGAARKMDDFVFLALGTGVGAGLFIGGSLYRGVHFAAGEAGDMTFPSDESEVKTRLSDVVGKQSIKKKAKKATGKKMSAAEALAKSRRMRALRPVAEDVVEHLSSSVMAISALLDPEAIIFGGGTSKAGEPLLKMVRERIERRVVRAELLLAKLGTDSQLYGALWGAQQATSANRRRAASS